MPRLPHFVRRVALVLLFFLVYLGLNMVSDTGHLRPFAVMAWNPALGVSVAIVCIWGKRALPLVFLAPLVAAYFIRGFPLTLLYPLFAGVLAVTKAFAIWQVGKRV